MIPASFDYVAPKTLPEAIAELVKHGDEAKVLAGGHSLIPLMKLRLSTPSFIVDIGRIKDLNYIREEDGHIAFGALTTHHDIEFSDLVKRKLPLLSSAASQIGDPQVRNRGTIGGAAAHADPFGDFPACLLALDAEFKVVGPRGERTIAAKDFFVETFTNALELEVGPVAARRQRRNLPQVQPALPGLGDRRGRGPGHRQGTRGGAGRHRTDRYGKPSLAGQRSRASVAGQAGARRGDPSGGR
jgi:hypothetical protein